MIVPRLWFIRLSTAPPPTFEGDAGGVRRLGGNIVVPSCRPQWRTALSVVSWYPTARGIWLGRMANVVPLPLRAAFFNASEIKKREAFPAVADRLLKHLWAPFSGLGGDIGEKQGRLAGGAAEAGSAELAGVVLRRRPGSSTYQIVVEEWVVWMILPGSRYLM